MNNDTLWTNLLRYIQNKFRYQTITSHELIAFICQQTQIDFNYFFDQYLKFTTLPILEVDLEENEADLHVKYRWVADVPDFKMPVKVTTSTEPFDFIYPNGLAKLLHPGIWALMNLRLTKRNFLSRSK